MRNKFGRVLMRETLKNNNKKNFSAETFAVFSILFNEVFENKLVDIER